MRKLLMAVLVLVGTSSLLVMPSPVRAANDIDGIEQAFVPETKGLTRAARLRTAADPDDPDTVWIGHIYQETFTAGGKMTQGGYGPYRVGRGSNFPTRAGSPVTIGDNGTWDFDRFQAAFVSPPREGESDSLQGWWPLARPYQSVGGANFPDHRRAFMGLDYGNQANYVINQGAPKRTFGVVGIWHRDRGNTTVYAASDSLPCYTDHLGGTKCTNVQPVQWSPTEVGGAGSTASAWCGIRSHGDLSHVDAVPPGGTGNPFNATLVEHQGNNGNNQVGSTSTAGTDHLFPGYGSQWDQMLYRDVQLAEGDGLNLSFNYSTNMSTAAITASQVRTGWFDKDPISNAQIGVGTAATPSNDGNFISSSAAGVNAPVDSFMVYMGAPVDDANVTFSAPLFVGGNEITTVYDPQRRWFSEVIKITGPGGIVGRELLSVAGINAPTTFAVAIPSGDADLQAIKDADGTLGDGGRVRLVFRVKTNRGFDDENGASTATGPFSSGTRGAAILDNVVTSPALATVGGDFEGANDINNDTAVGALNAWKSTGKPPAVYFHVHSVLPGQGLAYNDPCGGLDSPNRACNMYGKVATPGDHDNAEKNGGLFGSNTQDRQKWFESPTINLVSTGNGAGFYNAMGIDDEIARTTGDYRSFFSLYNAGFVSATVATGNFMSISYQSYPARQANGNVCWGETRHGLSIFFYGTRACFETFFQGAKANGFIVTTNPQNRPDSLRLYIQQLSRCFTFTGLVEATCSPTVGDNVGTYYDNISLELRDGAAAPELSIAIWNLINDAFPANRNAALIPAGFDTTAAQIRIGLNIAGQTGNTLRPAISGDSVIVQAPGTGKRLDMVFRVLPGPGNYVTTGSKASGVAQRPDANPKVAASAGDGSWFGTYMGNNGAFGSGGSGNTGSPATGGPGHGGAWNQHLWNSARMDTQEVNLFPTANNGGVIGLTAGNYAGMLHEGAPGSDDASKFTTLGILKNRCVMVVPTGLKNSTNIVCNGTGWGAYGAGSGWDGSTTTQEYTKILPDGLLTPGSHVQYFFRKSDEASTATFQMGPDTSFIFQGSEANVDGHRWQQFSVLPDRWKDGAWSVADRNAAAPACMLYIDWEDRRGDERFWVSVADSIGATLPARYGAHNGWHARGDQDITVAVGTDPSIAVYPHGGQPGTIWDMYGIKASESSTTSSSMGPPAAAAGLQAGKDDVRGPTGDMLRNYYRILLILTGDLLAGNIGPYNDKSSNDIGLLQDFANTAGGTAQPRAVWVQGRGFVEGQITGGTAAHPSFPPSYFGAGLASGDYRSFAGNTKDIVDLIPNAPTVTNGNIYGVSSNCFIQNDVLTLSGSIGQSSAARYEDTATNPNPKIASIYAPSSLPATTHPMVTLVDGWRIQSMGGRNTLTSLGTIDYYFNVFTNLFGSLNCLLAPGQPVGVGDTPNPALVNFLALRSENPLRSGAAKLTFGLTRKEKVELKVYDVTGRLVRTLANREFEAGAHDLFWDGTNEDGQSVARGVYFYQLRTPSFVSQKKLAVLKN